MKKHLLVVALISFNLFGCKRNPPSPSAEQICHEQWLETITALQVRLRNGPSAADIKALTVDLETFHELNRKRFSSLDEENFTILDSLLQTAIGLNQFHGQLDPAYHPEQLKLMLALRPDLKEHIAQNMHRPIQELYQDITFNSVIYTTAAREKACEACKLFLNEPSSKTSPH